MAARTPLERRLRWAVVGLAMLCAVLVLVVVAVLVYWKLYLLSPGADPFSRGPFLIRLGQTSAQLAWTLPGGGKAELVATAPDGTTVTARDGRFTGLEPGVRYLWTASVGGVGRAAGSFHTAPANPDAPVTFAAIGDYGSGTGHEWAVGRTLATEQPDFVVTAGDNSYLVGAPVLLDRNIFEPLHDVMLEAPLYATMGEHDLFYSNGAAVANALHLPNDAGRYVVEYGPVQVVLLGLDDGPAEVAFARRALARPGPRVRFVVLHRPVQPGDRILPLLRRMHVAAVIAGHLHRYERRVVGGIPEFVVGTSGEGPGAAAFTKRSPDAIVSLLNFGSLRVTVTATGTSYQFIDERGRVLDHYSTG
ncbi:MAG TPA: metallophosphoesterase [Gaiellales bacterium]|nr:metallophosphoesterase [Gaiellales bacterium]